MNEDEQIKRTVIGWHYEYDATMLPNGHLQFVRRMDKELAGEIWKNKDSEWEFNAYSRVVSYLNGEKLTHKGRITFRYLDHTLGFAIRHLDSRLHGGVASFNGVRENALEYLIGMFATKRKGE